MPFTFILDKPSDVPAAYKLLKEKLASTGGKISGNINMGTISAEGVEGEYVVGEDAVKITITKKPYILPNRLVERQIRTLFRGINEAL